MLFVFMSQPDFSCNPYALWKYINENTEFDTAWIMKRSEYLEVIKERGIRCALYNTLEGQRLVDEADCVVMNSYTFLALRKREGQIWVNLWHGSGIKAHDYYNYEMNPKHVKKLHDYFEKVDLMCVHSLDDRFKLAAQLHLDMRRIYVTGQARLDGVSSSKGKELLYRIYGERIAGIKKFIFFAPSFRANMSSHSGTIYSDNIFRVPDYKDDELLEFLEKNHAAIIYKLHPVEQTAFAGREFQINNRCLELTDEMLFHGDIRYYDILNAFDVMISDYSSIAYDFLLLDRPVVYLIPDYEEYTSDRGFVFAHVEDYMPGKKVFVFQTMLNGLEEAMKHPEKYQSERQFVLRQRFDYADSGAAKRCLDVIQKYKPISDVIEEYYCAAIYKMPTSAEQIAPYVNGDVEVVDSQKKYSEEEKQRILQEKKLLYVTSELPGKYRQLTGQSSDEIADLEFYYQVYQHQNHQLLFCQGGVDCDRFFPSVTSVPKDRIRIGFSGTIDNRIYFAMVQCICEVYSDCDIIFAGYIYGDYPVWLDGFENLHYVQATYEELPDLINSFDVAILPFFGRHQKKVPSELYQYLACGKQVVASDMPNLPAIDGVYSSKSVSEAINNITKALGRCNDEELQLSLQEVAFNHSWKNLAEITWNEK